MAFSNAQNKESSQSLDSTVISPNTRVSGCLYKGLYGWKSHNKTFESNLW